MKKRVLFCVACLLAVAGVFCGIYYPDSDINNTIGQAENIVIDEIKSIDENVVFEDLTENEEVSTTEEITDVTITDEKRLEVQEVEDESFELQGDIAYEGDRARSWNVELGDCQGLTYYSQVDGRWKNVMYSSVGNKSQTIGSSGCGPTSAAMVVSSIKGNITPVTMAKLFVQNGYRSANNGTYWSAYRAVADEFDIGYTETSDIQKAIQLLQDDNYVICSVGNGLFTTGGHYIVLVGYENNTFKIFDPYLYNGKFNTSTRRGKVEVSGNTVYCSYSKFKTYSNYKGFFCYKRDKKETGSLVNTNYKQGERVLIDDKVAVAYDNGASDILVDNAINQYWINRSVYINGNIYGLGTVVWDEGERVLVQIFDTQFWVRSNAVSRNIPSASVTGVTNNTSSNSSKYVNGNYITTTRLNVRSGPSTGYGIRKVYNRGTVFTVKEVRKNWGRTPSGWVCLDYARKK